MKADNQWMSFWDHVEELRKAVLCSVLTLCCGMLIAFTFHQEILGALVAVAPVLLQVVTPLEGFVVMMKITFWMGLLLTAPLWSFIWLRFFLPAVDSTYQRGVIVFVVLSFLSMVAGAFFAYHTMIPIAVFYLQQFSGGIGENRWTLLSYVDFVLMLLIVHAFLAEVACVLWGVVHLRWIHVETLVAWRRHMIVGAFILGALLTPPDLLTQFMVALPLIALYEGAIFYGRLRG